MKVATFLLSTLFGSAYAAPAIVWKSGKVDAEDVVHSSRWVMAKDVVGDAVETSNGSSLASAIFVIGRAEDGSESLSSIAGSGALPGVASKYDSAVAYYSHVSGVRGGYSIAHDVENTGRSVAELSLNELSHKLTSTGSDTPFVQAEEVVVGDSGLLSVVQKEQISRAKKLEKADVIVVNVSPNVDKSILDSLVVKTIEHKSISSVILTAVRSIDEIKEERTMEHRRRMKVMEAAGRRLATNSASRRLEQQQNQDDDMGASYSNLVGVYYVHMTPNIFAGLAFALFFAVIAYTGISCMGMIAGQDVYVNKMPTIGREA